MTIQTQSVSHDGENSDIPLVAAVTDQCIAELEWYATRKMDLRSLIAPCDADTWADVMLSEIEDLRRALAAERAAR